MGCHPHVDAITKSKEEQHALVRGWLVHEPSRWRHDRVVGHTDIWAHTLSRPTPAEREYLMSTQPSVMTKMGCARYLEVIDNRDREDLWRRLGKPALVTAFVEHIGGAAAVAVDVGAGRGRGRGHGRGGVAGRLVRGRGR